MNFKSMTILALAVFLVGLFAVPAFAETGYARPVRVSSCATSRAQPTTIYVSPTDDMYNCSSIEAKCITNPIQGALYAVGSMFESREAKQCRIVSRCSSRCCPRYCP